MQEPLLTPEEILENNGYDIDTLQEEKVILYRNPNFSTAIVGMSDDYRVVYDYNKMIEHLITYEGWSEQEAIDWIDFNTLRTYTSEGQMPIVMYPIEQ